MSTILATRPEDTLDATRAYAPLSAPNNLYECPGVDLFREYKAPPSQEEMGENGPEGVPLSWHAFSKPGSFTEDDADEMLREMGYERTTPWDHSISEYATAEIAKVQ